MELRGDSCSTSLSTNEPFDMCLDFIMENMEVLIRRSESSGRRTRGCELDQRSSREPRKKRNTLQVKVLMAPEDEERSNLDDLILT